ncbi:hypothetical protein BC628DRAFT_476325 [Trametes gibbosa]|nr:hypothetical protein BC628DRAFT_476325 [Trametes gibbosa]
MVNARIITSAWNKIAKRSSSSCNRLATCTILACFATYGHSLTTRALDCTDTSHSCWTSCTVHWWSFNLSLLVMDIARALSSLSPLMSLPSLSPSMLIASPLYLTDISLVYYGCRINVPWSSYTLDLSITSMLVLGPLAGPELVAFPGNVPLPYLSLLEC